MYVIDPPTQRLIADVLNPLRGPHNVSRAELRHSVAALKQRNDYLENELKIRDTL